VTVADAVDLESKVAFLRRPDAYPDRPTLVEAVETHISWVFLTPRFAYKLKKPVRQPYLDFRTVDARHQDCEEEVRLNRRLAGDLYLGVLALVETADHRLCLDGSGRTVDWLVHMHRLPSERMLDHMIAKKALRPADLYRVGERLARFYRDLPPVDVDVNEYVAGFAADVDENRRELSDPLFGLPATRATSVCDWLARFLDTHRALFATRVRQGRIIEGHGDLRPEHVCLAAEPVVIDCLEFKRAFRILDAADELAFLALECERLGAPWAAQNLFAPYRAVTCDRPPPALIHFFQAFRATLRAKLAVWHNRDHDVRDSAKWVRRALDYLALAERHAAAAGQAR
jgi:aminoglycoside phosphotransferase family enzyme